MNTPSIWSPVYVMNAPPCQSQSVYPMALDTSSAAEANRKYECQSLLKDLPSTPRMEDLKHLPPCLQVEYVLSNGEHKDKYPEAPRIPMITDQHHNMEHRWVMKNWMWQLDCYMVELTHSCKFTPSVQDILEEDADIETASIPIINMEQELAYKLKRVFNFLRLLEMAWGECD